MTRILNTKLKQRRLLINHQSISSIMPFPEDESDLKNLGDKILVREKR